MTIKKQKVSPIQHILLCDECEAPMHFVINNKAQTKFFYRCKNGHQMTESKLYPYVEYEPIEDPTHDWKCVSVGEYDTLYQCTKCKEKHMENADNSDTYIHKRVDICRGE